MRKWLAVLAVLGGLGAVLAGPWAASSAAAGLTPAVADCYANGRLTRHYTIPELRTALNTIPIDIKEYSNCAQVIEQQLLAQLGQLHGSGGSGSGGGSFLPTWLVVVLAVLVLGGAGVAVTALRRKPPPGRG